MSELPLQGLLVLEFSQYLSGPSAGLRLADLGARVIKIERPNGGDACRKLAIRNMWVDEQDSLLFHTINRNKESFIADLKRADDLALVQQLIRKADVMTHNFRPGIMEKAGLSFQDVQQINPRIIYAEISGYGKKGPWQYKPGQDLLLQAITGLAYTSGNAAHPPMPFGLSIADYQAGAQLVQGILAALIRRQKTGKGAWIEVSLIETLLDFQFELLTTYYNSGKEIRRSTISNGNPLLGAPYGLYKTQDGYLAIAMMDIAILAKAIGAADLEMYTQDHAFSDRDQIKVLLTAHLQTGTTASWLEKLHAEDLWAMEVLNWKQMETQEAYRVLDMEQSILMNGKEMITTRCPIRINGKTFRSALAAPELGAQQESILNELIK